MDSSNQTYQFDNLPKHNALTGAEYVYTVVESTLEGFTPVYPTGTLNIVNNLNLIDLTVTKHWTDNGTDADATFGTRSVTVQLVRKLQGEADTAFTAVSGVA